MAAITQKVALKNVRFFSYHGFYPEEQILGNVFFIDVETSFPVEGSGNDDILKTVNYELLFEIASDEMQKPKKLLETVAFNILQRVRERFAFVKEVRVAIRKMNPPLKGQIENSLVELNYTADEL